MIADCDKFRPPIDRCFGVLLEYAVSGTVPVYGALLDAEKVQIRRFDENWPPENSADGQKVVASLMQGWNTGRPLQPWLYVEKGIYICSDDYFFIALLEIGRPSTFAAQILGKPLRQGLIQKTGPLPLDQVKAMLGIEKRDMTNLDGKPDSV
jgi:hypothetical protein